MSIFPLISRRNYSFPPVRHLLQCLLLLVLVWNLHNLQILDRWLSELLKQQYQQNQQFWIRIRRDGNRGQEGITFLSSRVISTSTRAKQNYFSKPETINRIITLGPHFLTTTSGCRISRWVFPTTTKKMRYRDCNDVSKRKLLLPSRNGTYDQLHSLDTIYVTLKKLPVFVEKVLPMLRVDVVILSGQVHNVPPVPVGVVRSLIEHTHVVHWFCQNLNIHVDFATYRRGKEKVSPFPYGLKQTTHKHHKKDAEALLDYEEVFFRTLLSDQNGLDPLGDRQQRSKEGNTIFVGPLHPWPERVAKRIPGVETSACRKNHSDYWNPRDYYTALAKHDFVLSPNGDRPECYRHYEALGLGVIPITELDQDYYYHLKEGPIVFNTNDWNLTHLQQQVLPNVMRLHRVPRTLRLGTLRNMVFEEYWMEYADTRVKKSLNWWDQVKNESTTLKELY